MVLVLHPHQYWLLVVLVVGRYKAGITSKSIFHERWLVSSKAVGMG